MVDCIYKGHFKGLDIAFTYAVTTSLVNDLVVRHDNDPVAAHILGRAATSGVLSAALLPKNQRLNICWKYPGSLRTIIVDAGSDGSARGFVSPVHLNDVAGSIDELYGEKGELRIIRTEDSKVLNSSTAMIPLQDVVRDLAYHFCVSDQVETGMISLIGLQADEKAPVSLSQGWMIQALPGCDLERFDRIRARMEGDTFRELLSSGSEADTCFEKLAAALVSDEVDEVDIRLDEYPAPFFKCNCSKEKMGDVLRTIPIPTRMEIVKDAKPMVLSCQFCNARYELSIDECTNAWNNKPLEG
ncbi:Hsp33 family molecular chaperone HslO [Verrucomicrobiota bacterium]